MYMWTYKSNLLSLATMVISNVFLWCKQRKYVHPAPIIQAVADSCFGSSSNCRTLMMYWPASLICNFWGLPPSRHKVSELKSKIALRLLIAFLLKSRGAVPLMMAASIKPLLPLIATGMRTTRSEVSSWPLPNLNKLSSLRVCTWEIFSSWNSLTNEFKVSCPIRVRPHPLSMMPYPGEDTSKDSWVSGATCWCSIDWNSGTDCAGSISGTDCRTPLKCCTIATPDFFDLFRLPSWGFGQSLCQCPTWWHRWHRDRFLRSATSRPNCFFTVLTCPKRLDFWSLAISILFSFHVAANTSATSASSKTSPCEPAAGSGRAPCSERKASTSSCNSSGDPVSKASKVSSSGCSGSCSESIEPLKIAPLKSWLVLDNLGSSFA